MKWLSAALAFVNASTLFALVAGILYQGLSRPLATFAIILGLFVAFLAYWATADVPLRVRKPKPPPPPVSAEPKSKRQQRREERARKALADNEAPRWQYRSIWFWVLVACF